MDVAPAEAVDPDRRVVDLLEAAVEELGGVERPGQTAMALAVAQAFRTGTHLLVQAGTGTGKSLGYLVPALLHDGEGPVVVSTATLALQAQLVDRDLPLLADAVQRRLGRRPTFATLKGRANYACLHRVRDGVPDEQGELLPAEEAAPGPVAAEVLRAREWAEEQSRTSGSGDRDRLQPGVVDRAWAQVSVGAQECLGATRCPYGQECFAEAARRLAARVDVVVTNHALLAIDALEGVPVLPDHEVVVVDEAHELVARVTAVASGELWPALVERTARRVRKMVDEEVADRLLDAADALRDGLGPVLPGRLDRLPPDLLAAVAGVRDAARAVQSGMSRPASPKSERSVEGDAARRVAKAMLDGLFVAADRMAAGGEADVVWLERRDRLGPLLKVAPLSVADVLREQLFREVTAVLTSATLAVGGGFEPVAGSLGLLADDAPGWEGRDVGSPFDYRRQAILYVARRLPPPGRDGMPGPVLDELVDLVRAAGGRTLGLFSSRRAALEAAAAVRARLPEQRVLCQGDDLVPALVREFAEDAATCLFGTLSLWQGVDVPGSACHLVVVDRIPFPRPDDPLSSARQRAVERAGGNGFMTVAAAHAALLLAQGVGRLVRRAEDRGVVAVLDSRLATARYGGFLRASLPPMWPTDDREVVLGALRRLDASAPPPVPAEALAVGVAD